MEDRFKVNEPPEIHPKIFGDINLFCKNQPIERSSFVIGDINYILIPSPSKTDQGEINGQPAEYHQSQNEWAIYIWEDLPENIQRVLLFHEIIEIYLRNKFGMETTTAHNATLPYESCFKNEIIFKENERNILEDLRDKYSVKKF